MYGTALSKSIWDGVAVSPRKYSNMKGSKDRFYSPRSTKNTLNHLPFYDSSFTKTGGPASFHSTLSYTPIKYSNIRSQKARFPKVGFLQDYVDKDMLESLNKLDYNTDKAHKCSLATSLEHTPRKYASMRSTQPRFPEPRSHTGHGEHLGPGSYRKIHPDTSTARYLTTVQKVKKSPRKYGVMRSHTKRFGKNSFLNVPGSGSSAMWPPMTARF
jgi:hypothetical protein